MNILLLNPRSSLPIDVRTQPSLGLAYIGAVSERLGHRVRLVDFDVEQPALAEVLAEGYDLVGITANTSQVRAAWRQAEEIGRLSAAPVMLGGPHPSVLAEESAGKPGVRAVVCGEGEATWEELCALAARSELGNDEALAAVRGIAFRNAAGEVVRNAPRPAIEDLDALPLPAYHLFKMERYTSLQPAIDHPGEHARTLNLMTSRGCPYRCIYCSQSIFPSKWRARSAQNVLAEWRHLVEDLGATEIGVLDDSFNIDTRRVEEICDLLIAGGINRVPWIMINGVRANLVNEPLLRKMKQAGCKRLAFGVESGNQRILDSINKRLTLDQVRAAFAAARKVGLETIGFFMIGLPGDTAETMDDTIRFAIELDPLVANFSMATPFPGTELHDIAVAGGQLLMKDWDDYVFFEGKARYELGPLTASLAERKWHEAYRRFYLRPKRVLRTLGRKETWLNLPRVAKMALRLVLPKQQADGASKGGD